MIYIRTDANEVIATGHVMRCLTVALELKKIGHEVTFLVSDDDSTKLIVGTGYNYLVLHTNWNLLNTDDEVVQISEALENSFTSSGKRPLILIDSYYINNEYIRRIKKYAFVAVFDDLGKETYDADILINYNIFYHIHDYDYMYANSECRLLLGSAYVPLREQFRNSQRMKAEVCCRGGKIRINILVMCGGGDSLGFLKGFAEFLRDHKETDSYEYTLVAGKYNPFIKELKEIVGVLQNVTLYENIYEIASVMRNCDVAVSSASTVLYECCAMGIPTIFYCAADNQENDVEAFSSDGLMMYAGDIRICKQDVYGRIFELLVYLTSNPNAMEMIRRRMMQITDGMGAVRIAHELDELFRQTRG